MKTKSSTNQNNSAIKKRSTPKHIFFDCLSSEVTINVLVRVDSQQPFSLFSCKILNSLSDAEHVMNKVSIETIIDHDWLVNSNANILFGRCLECKNPDALHHYGLISEFIISCMH